MKPLLKLKIVSICNEVPKPPESLEINIGIWEGDYIALVALLIEYNPEFRVRVSKTRIIIKEYTDETKTKFKYYKCVALGHAIVIPRYERRPYCPIQADPPVESALREELDTLHEDQGSMH